MNNISNEELELIEHLQKTDPRIIIKENMRFVFVIGQIFTREDQILFDNILDFFDNTNRTYLDIQYDVTDYDDEFVKRIEDKFEIGNGNYHLMMLIVNPHNNNVNEEPYLYIEEITDFIIDLHQKYGSVNEMPKKQVSNINRQGNTICFDDYPTHSYIAKSTSSYTNDESNGVYQRIQTRGANDKTYYKSTFDLGFEFTPVDADIDTQLKEVSNVNNRVKMHPNHENKPHNRFKNNNLNSRIRKDRVRVTGNAETTMESYLDSAYNHDDNNPEEVYPSYNLDMIRHINHGYFNRMYNNDEYISRELTDDHRTIESNGVMRFDDIRIDSDDGLRPNFK